MVTTAGVICLDFLNGTISLLSDLRVFVFMSILQGDKLWYSIFLDLENLEKQGKKNQEKNYMTSDILQKVLKLLIVKWLLNRRNIFLGKIYKKWVKYLYLTIKFKTSFNKFNLYSPNLDWVRNMGRLWMGFLPVGLHEKSWFPRRAGSSTWIRIGSSCLLMEQLLKVHIYIYI